MSAYRDERGTTLIEVIMAVAILGIAFSALVGGLYTAVASSARHHDEAVANAVLLGAAERVKPSTVAYLPCGVSQAAYLTAAQSAVGTSGVTISVVSVEYWNGALFVTSPCPLPVDRVQRITLAATRRNASEATSFLKRDPS